MGPPEQRHDRSAPEEAVLYKGWESAARGGPDTGLPARCAVGHTLELGAGDSRGGVNLLINKMCRLE